MSKHGTQEHQLRVVGDGMPGTTRVELDGVDVTRGLRALKYEIGVDILPTVTLDVVLWDISTHAENPRLAVSEDGRKALIQLGWTPPEGDGAS